ncbi:phytanoyl-CoA dioxygenase domain-containing protein 1 homolog [Babylonia areolata]|uniref:phytanoyl-CoA dioxygenase domain-containing protein 1 homolog n=1 Tax=Babylonia areolata TaxID=304850 RepID=UPI003FD09CEF
MDLSKVKEQFDRDGYAIIENFLSEEEVQSLRTEMATIINNLDVKEHRSVFKTTDDRVSDEYFMNSGDKIRFFFEAGAIAENGQLTVDKSRCVNKIGHALHCLNPTFKKVTFSDKVKKVAETVGFEDPVVCQSMYIFKQPRIGGKVTAHQDSSFLYTTPQRLMGLWFALEDATLENGCLWFIPGSHKDGVHGNRRMVRRVNPQPGASSTEFIGTEIQHGESEYIAGPVKKGTLVLIHGEVVHKSEHNHSEQSREIYTFHMYDHAKAVYDARNWLQPTEANTFSHLMSEV